MTPILTLEKAKLYKQISNSINTDKFNEIAIQSQQIELMPKLGEELFYDLIRTPLDHTFLLDGGDYTYNGKTFVNVGLYQVLTAYWYAYNSYYGEHISTAFGMRQKLNNDVSKPLEVATQKTLFNHNVNYAFNLWQNVERYMSRVRYPMYICRPHTKNIHFKMSKIG